MSKSDKNAEIETPPQLAEKIKESARQIWLAGLGAYNKAEEDAGRFFDKLVKDGEEIETKTRGAVEKHFKAVEDTVEGVKEKATDTFGKLEGVFDQRVSKALHRLRMPSKTDVESLYEKIAELEARIVELEKRKE
ncbi:MAG: phasin family protein [Hahellaceae bacterium]|nr:phasin family protein [Hahellaceae bacterium]